MAEIPKKIDGTTGPYDPNTAIGKGANAGREAGLVGNAFDGDIQYAFNEGNIWQVASSLAFSHESLKSLDSNQNGSLDINDNYWNTLTEEYNAIIDKNPELSNLINKDLLDENNHIDKQKLFGLFNLNNDKMIDDAENLALICLQDALGDNNGALSQAERDLSAILFDPAAKDTMNKYLEHYKLNDYLAKFVMPEEVKKPADTTSTKTDTTAKLAEAIPIENTTKPEQKAAETKPNTHEVVKGDTLWKIITEQYGHCDMKMVKKIAEANKIPNPNLIFPGQNIVLPDTL